MTSIQPTGHFSRIATESHPRNGLFWQAPAVTLGIIAAFVALVVLFGIVAQSAQPEAFTGSAHHLEGGKLVTWLLGRI
jgi:hypothetical protein